MLYFISWFYLQWHHEDAICFLKKILLFLQVEVEYVVTHHLKPHPKEIMQKEKQLVLFKGNYYVYSPYTIAKQTTAVVVGTKNVESHGKMKPTSTSENGMVYGPFENIAPFSISPLDIHYENNSPFLVITKLERTIEVSHWGNIAVEEVFNLYHTGAILKGSFSRYEYQRESQSGLSSVKSFKVCQCVLFAVECC